MAYVGITHALKGEIRGTIRQLAQKELNALGPVPEIVPTISEAEEAYWGPYIHLRDVIPTLWKGSERHVTLIARGKEGETILHTHYTFNQHIPTPPRCHTMLVTLSYEDERVKRFAEHYYNSKDIQDRWTGVRDTLMDFLNTCKSLNEAVKLMPEIVHYVPKYMLDKLEEKRGPRSKESKAVVPDEEARNNMIASLVAARIS